MRLAENSLPAFSAKIDSKRSTWDSNYLTLLLHEEGEKFAWESPAHQTQSLEYFDFGLMAGRACNDLRLHVNNAYQRATGTVH